jgi:hypothetical protein
MSPRLVLATHNILEPVLRQPSCYSTKHCSKSLLKIDFIPFLSRMLTPPLPHVHSSALVTCVVLVLMVLSNFWHQWCLRFLFRGRPSTGSRMLCCKLVDIPRFSIIPLSRSHSTKLSTRTEFSKAVSVKASEVSIPRQHLTVGI